MTAWYVDRAAGLVSWALLSASMVLGLALSSKVLGTRVRPNWLQDLHRGISGLAVVFVGVHVAGAIGDNYLHFGATEVLVPFASSWRRGAITLGVVSAYLLVAVELSSLLRARLPKATWRKVHYLSFPLFLMATVHGITAGTEMATTVGIVVAALTTAAVAGLTALRVFDERDTATTAARVPARVPAPAVREGLAPEPPYAPANVPSSSSGWPQ